MKIATIIAIVGSILIPMNSATLYYVVSVERRLTRLETIVIPPARDAARSNERPA